MYHGGQRQLCAFEAERPITIEHYLTVFARALGIEFEDTFKKYRLWADPDRIFADSTPCQQLNGVDPARARDLITRTFVPLGTVAPGPAAPERAVRRGSARTGGLRRDTVSPIIARG